MAIDPDCLRCAAGVCSEHFDWGKVLDRDQIDRVQREECPNCGSKLREGPHGGLSINRICDQAGCGAAFNDMGPFGVERIPHQPPGADGKLSITFQNDLDAARARREIGGAPVISTQADKAGGVTMDFDFSDRPPPKR